MRFNRYNDIGDFYRDTCAVLLRHEAQNLVPLGNVIIGFEGRDKTGWRDPANWFMATVTDGAQIRLTAVMTPPHNLTLYATDNQFTDVEAACLLSGILEADVSVPGVMTENRLAGSFARAYAAAKQLNYTVNKNQRIYELTRVSPEIPSVGSLRLARESDMAFLPYWFEGFSGDCFGSVPRVQADAEGCRYHIASKRLYILEDGGTPVSMAKINREMRTACGVGYVYTPPYFRGKGYATSCVAAVSRIILKRGFTKCVLYTDLANPTSNGIYQKIGYRPVCDSLEIRFA